MTYPLFILNRSNNKTAMKTVSMNLRGLTEDGEAVAGLLPKLEGMFNDVGLTLKKDNETFKSTYEIFEELAGIWGQLTDFQRANLLENIAGKRQGVVVASILNNWKDASSALESGLNSAGSAAREMERISDSVEFKMQQLRNSVIGFWQENIDTEAFKAFIDIGNKFMQVLTAITQKTGLFPPAIALVTTAIILLNSSLLDMVMTNGALIVSFKDLIFSLTAFGAVAKSVGTFIKGSILPIAAISAASFAIQFLTQKYVDYRNEQKKIKEQNDELVRSYSKNTDNINNLISKYKELNKQVVAGRMSESNEEYVAVQNELNSLMPSLTASIDEQGNAHLKSASAIDEEIEYVKQLQEEYNKLTLASFEENINKVQKKLNNLRARSGEISEQLLVGSMSDADRRNLGIEKLSIDRQATQQYDEYARLIKDNIEASLELKGVTNSLTEEIWAYIDALVDAQKTSIDGSDSANELSNSIIDQVITVANAKEEIEKLNKSLPTYKDEVANIILKLKDALPEQANLNALLKAFGITVDGVKNDLSGLASVTSDVLNEYKAASSAVETYNKLLNDMAEGKKLSAAEAMELIVKEEALANAISFENGMVKVNIEAVKNMRDAKIQSYKDVGDAALRELEVEKNKTFAVIQGYLLQTQAIKSYAEARRGLAKVEANDKALQLTGAMGAAAEAQVNDLYDSLDSLEQAENTIKSLMSAGVTSLKSTGGSSKSGSSSKSATKVAEKYERQLEDNFNLLQKIASLENQITTTQNERVLLSDNNEIRSSINKEIELVQRLYDMYNDLAAIQGNQREKMASQFAKVAKGVVTVSKDMNVLSVNSKIYNRLSDTQKEKIDNLIKAYGELSDAYNENLQKKLELKAQVQDLNNELKEMAENAKEAYEEWRDNVMDIVDEVYDAQKEYYEKKKEQELDAIDEEMDALEKSHDRKMDMLEEELDAYEKIINAKLDAINDQASEEDYRKELTQLQKERQKILSKINVLSLDDSLESKAQREALIEELGDKEQQIAELTTNRERELRKDNLQDMLEDYREDIEAKKKAENEKYEALKERLEDEKKEVERYYDELIADQKRYNRIQQNLYSGNLDALQSDFAAFASFIKKNSSIIGEALTNDILNKLNSINLQTGRDLWTDYQNTNGGGSQWSAYKSQIQQIAGYKKDYENASGTNKAQIKAEASANAEKVYATLPPELVAILRSKSASATESWLQTLHSGGVVGGASGGLSSLFNSLLNTNADERIVKMLERELAVPETNLSKYAIPNLQNIMSRSSSPNIIQIDKLFDIDEFNNNTPDDINKIADKAFDRFIERIKPYGFVPAVR